MGVEAHTALRDVLRGLRNPNEKIMRLSLRLFYIMCTTSILFDRTWVVFYKPSLRRRQIWKHLLV